ncbi:MAG: hypothetical protein V4450_07425 [Bacteroidota bacterium]
MKNRRNNQPGTDGNTGGADQNQTPPNNQPGTDGNTGGADQNSGGPETAGRNMSSFQVSVITGNGKPQEHQKLMKVKIQYPSDWTKDRFFKDGDVKEVAPETAKTFIEIGIATEVEE